MVNNSLRPRRSLGEDIEELKRWSSGKKRIRPEKVE